MAVIHWVRRESERPQDCGKLKYNELWILWRKTSPSYPSLCCRLQKKTQAWTLPPFQTASNKEMWESLCIVLRPAVVQTSQLSSMCTCRGRPRDGRTSSEFIHYTMCPLIWGIRCPSSICEKRHIKETSQKIPSGCLIYISKGMCSSLFVCCF